MGGLIEGGHGSAGARRAIGGVDRGAPRLRRGATRDRGVDRGAPRLRRGATRDGGFGGHFGAPMKMDFEAWFDKGVTDGLPVVPPTRERVETMLTAARRARDELLGER